MSVEGISNNSFSGDARFNEDTRHVQSDVAPKASVVAKGDIAKGYISCCDANQVDRTILTHRRGVMDSGDQNDKIFVATLWYYCGTLKLFHYVNYIVFYGNPKFINGSMLLSNLFLMFLNSSCPLFIELYLLVAYLLICYLPIVQEFPSYLLFSIYITFM